MIRALCVALAAVITPAQWQSDVDQLIRELPKRHKNIYAHLSKAEFGRIAAELRAEAERGDAGRIRAAMLKLVASIGDAHTSMWAPGDGVQFFPVRIAWFRDGWYVISTHEDYRELAGRKITRIGHMPVDAAMEALRPYVPHENETWFRHIVPQYIMYTFLLHAAGITSSSDTAEFGFEGGGVAVRAVVPGGSFSRVAATDHIPEHLKKRNISYWATLRDEGRTVYVQYNRCRDEREYPFSAFMTEVTRLWSSPGVERVVVDLRWNGGGNSQVFQPFIREIRKTRFRRYVLIGPATFSSGVLNAWQLRKNARATLVGEPTGGKPNCYGDVRLLKLPNSGIEVAYSTKYFRLVPEDPPSLMPDVTIGQTFADYMRGADPVLESLPGLRNVGGSGVDGADVVGGRKKDLKPAHSR